MNNIIKDYYYITKPGIVYGNLLSVLAGYLLISGKNIHITSFLAVLIGTACIIGSACVVNNYIDREIDKKMERTKKRVSITKKISVQNAGIFAALLVVIGIVVLLQFTNSITVLVGLIGYVDYIVLYGITKRKSIHGTLIGSISGATPPVAGYTAATGRIDIGAILLFLVLTVWQMPHFYAIAMYRLSDYKVAKIPVLPVVKGVQQAKLQIYAYIFALIIICFLFWYFHYTGIVFFIVMILLNLYWMFLGIKKYNELEAKVWGKKMFLFSLIVLLVMSCLMMLNMVLP